MFRSEKYVLQTFRRTYRLSISIFTEIGFQRLTENHFKAFHTEQSPQTISMVTEERGRTFLVVQMKSAKSRSVSILRTQSEGIWKTSISRVSRRPNNLALEEVSG